MYSAANSFLSYSKSKHRYWHKTFLYKVFVSTSYNPVSDIMYATASKRKIPKTWKDASNLFILNCNEILHHVNSYQSISLFKYNYKLLQQFSWEQD